MYFELRHHQKNKNLLFLTNCGKYIHKYFLIIFCETVPIITDIYIGQLVQLRKQLLYTSSKTLSKSKKKSSLNKLVILRKTSNINSLKVP